MRSYLTTAFSPSMLPSLEEGVFIARVQEVPEGTFRTQAWKALKAGDLVPAVGHEVTAEILRRRLRLDFDPFARVNITLRPGERVLAAIPQFRPLEGSREFTRKEVERAEFRFFIVELPRVIEG